MEDKKVSDSIKLYISQTIDDFRKWCSSEFASKKTEVMVYAFAGLILTCVVVAVVTIVTRKF